MKTRNLTQHFPFISFFKKFFLTALGGISAAVLNIFDLIQLITHPKKQKKTRIATCVITLGLNMTYIVGSFLNFLNPIGLAAIAWSSITTVLYKDSYVAHQTEKNKSNTKTFVNDEYFINRCRVGFRTTEFIASGLLFGGLFCFPLGIVGAILLGTTKLLEHYDKHNQYAFCRKISCFWNWLTGKKNASETKKPTHSSTVTMSTGLVHPHSKPMQQPTVVKNLRVKNKNDHCFMKELVRQRYHNRPAGMAEEKVIGEIKRVTRAHL